MRVFGLFGLFVLGAWSAGCVSRGGAAARDSVVVTPEPLIPTRAPAQAGAEAATPAALVETVAVTHTGAAAGTWSGRERWGVGVVTGPISRYDVGPFRLGWYLDWDAQPDPPRPGGVEYVPMIRLEGGVLSPDAEAIAAIARAAPGSLWLVGNEPDVVWQDNVEPAVYAMLYHAAYTAVKGADPTAQVCIGGIAQPTPLRFRYLEEMLASYREQFAAEAPVDAWHVHNFVLREERDSWGVGIPPGLPDDRGLLYEVGDCDDLGLFRQQIVDLRRWMAREGYRGYPLIVSEYGIPMPEDYGFPPERIVAFAAGTFDFFATAVDSELGDPADDHRLVQRWCWYSLDAPDSYYPPGRLLDPLTGERTPVGEGWAAYVAKQR